MTTKGISVSLILNREETVGLLNILIPSNLNMGKLLTDREIGAEEEDGTSTRNEVWSETILHLLHVGKSEDGYDTVEDSIQNVSIVI